MITVQRDMKIYNQYIVIQGDPTFYYCSPHCEKSSLDCCCGIRLNETMVACDCATICPNKEWFHLSCVGLKKKPPKSKYNW